ncbi:MAG: PD-(D/E)XK nuclease family protein [Prevotella sp.]|nr:PD-(D/E)XK nuclease family protein [Prevotella sp.]
MKSFLEYVAQDIIQKHGTNLSRIAVVFPNKRTALFLNEHLARSAGQPIWSPAYLTISELFRQHSPLELGDSIKLVSDLYRSYIECVGGSETLDHFYGWGQLLLADFDDIDKNMADADRVFANVRDIHELDDLSYLTPQQTELLKSFFSNFADDQPSRLKDQFLRFWCQCSNIYHHFNRRLSEQGIAYEGALYRQVATAKHVDFEYDLYLFVGFNMLQKVEQQLFKRLKENGQAKFYWDFDHYYMPSADGIHSEAGHYIAQYLADFPNELDGQDAAIYDRFRQPKELTFISAPTENIQARYISTWLKEKNRIADGRRTAIVLCDEHLLPSVIHSLPDEVEKVNVTTGYPLAQSPFAHLLSALFALRQNGYVAPKDCFRLRYVNALLRHPYIKYVTDDASRLLSMLNIEAKIYYPTSRQLAIDEGTRLLFAAPDSAAIGPLVRWMLQLIQLIAHNAADVADPLFQESLFRTYTLLNRIDGLIAEGDLQVDAVTLQKLIAQLIQSTSIPFHGEPAEGLQIMGVLETRNIDFDHVLLLSCNEGNMPKGVNDTSFIPYSIRKAYDLTTVDHKVAIFSYYFHRLLQRATDVTLMYNNSTEDGHTGEMSRFMLQLMVESGQSIRKINLKAGQVPAGLSSSAVAKTAEMMDILLNRYDAGRQKDKPKDTALLSPTAINSYLRCQLQFYYNYVCGLRELDDNDDEEIDNRIFGNIFHEAANIIYTQLAPDGGRVTKGLIAELLRDATAVERAVDAAFRKELFKQEKRSPMQPEYNGIQLINREVIIHYLRQLLTIDQRLAPFTILGLENDVLTELHVSNASIDFTTTIGGRIDRLDSIDDGTGGERIRVVDYKTGGRKQRMLPDVEAVFDTANIKHHSDYYLQTMLYADIVRNDRKVNPDSLPVSPALLYIQHAAADDYDPTLCFGREPIRDVAPHAALFHEQLHRVVNELFNPEVPFTPTADPDRCRTCPYAKLCGK